MYLLTHIIFCVRIIRSMSTIFSPPFSMSFIIAVRFTLSFPFQRNPKIRLYISFINSPSHGHSEPSLLNFTYKFSTGWHIFSLFNETAW